MKKILTSACSAFIALSLLTGCTTTESDPQAAQAALVPAPLPTKEVATNPYMASSDNSIHNDAYSTDVTDAAAPLGINSVVSSSLETKNVQAPSAAFYDSKGHAITPFLGGISIADMDGDAVTRLGSFVPTRDDGGGYAFQISYSFVDAHDRVVALTSNGHLLVMKTMDENGQVLPTFEKAMDVDIVEQAVKALGPDIDQRLLSVIYDYEGNLWFCTGGFRIDPNRDPAGFIGYISREYMQQLDTGQTVPLEGNIFFYPLAAGEGAENGIAANPDGAVVLTNMACYMLTAQDGAQLTWRTAYGSNGANDAQEGSDFTGGGLAWGSGTTPTLTGNLVLFTDNLDPINLIALSSDTGEVLAQTPVLDQLGEDVPVSVENSILVYDGGQGTVSVIVANWFGAGNAGLADPDADSAIQSYANIYDANWMAKGNAYIAPGVERVDFTAGNGGYTAKKVWSRSDIRETTMIKLSTATGYLYGYWQDADTGTWRYEALDFDTGETLLTQDVSNSKGYNNMAVGLIADPSGNGIYCPTNEMEMVCWRDEFAYLPNSPAKTIDAADTGRARLLDESMPDGFKTASYLMSATINNLRENQTLALRLNGLDAKPDDYTLFYQDQAGLLHEMDASWTLCDSNGQELDEKSLDKASVYELRFNVSDGDALDCSEREHQGTYRVILAQKDA